MDFSVRFRRHAIVLTVHYFLILDRQASEIFNIGHQLNDSLIPLLSHMSAFHIEEHVQFFSSLFRKIGCGFELGAFSMAVPHSTTELQRTDDIIIFQFQCDVSQK